MPIRALLDTSALYSPRLRRSLQNAAQDADGRYVYEGIEYLSAEAFLGLLGGI